MNESSPNILILSQVLLCSPVPPPALGFCVCCRFPRLNSFVAGNCFLRQIARRMREDDGHYSVCPIVIIISIIIIIIIISTRYRSAHRTERTATHTNELMRQQQH